MNLLLNCRLCSMIFDPAKYIKAFAIIALASFMTLILWSLVGNLIEPTVSVDTAKWIGPFSLIFFVAVALLMCFSLVPVGAFWVIKTTERMNLSVRPRSELPAWSGGIFDNADSMVKFVSYFVWSVWIIGLIVIGFLAGNLIIQDVQDSFK